MYRRPEFEFKWPNLSRTDYQVTSPKSQEYNCFAWAAGEDDRWWQPIPGEQFYWPEGVPQEETLEAYIQSYQTLRYEICIGDRLEVGYQKIAIYVDSNGIPTHAARQLANGKWTSKLGWLEDIEHELDGLTGDRYGVVGQILKRAVN
ncbi:MAG: hypothetical protein JGK17_13045 [Microcoleus sp. PH2017_10_PVI_O_A]|uniref:DUF7689 domain-containing protein n=1 Tax=unclassified Microcoleus TaxID=2642155 RepID=UPI001E054B1D|nr:MULTISPECIES: hypothetical protein [unclassified Microcoleus]TAE80239.1 MAG: hypothetical protein EAZ83_18750 [Oscillatoriales cyanobacterium]MCC3406489.1 hypothetical protein [Microcoleus sp. PH2017_10_PVI_O_A]MCC3460514.1 hypothetical protein [Microcoleus sp. PH2017_11_PCY_U_A]MCC3478931.1 hypothetical protein [Microcoleus sp. PH2017_12_PCY_D_A]MCC3559866.1 hypothetical protein [Microcoleus sp. PH2017_27_LUM_O_A]